MEITLQCSNICKSGNNFTMLKHKILKFGIWFGHYIRISGTLKLIATVTGLERAFRIIIIICFLLLNSVYTGLPLSQIYGINSGVIHQVNNQSFYIRGYVQNTWGTQQGTGEYMTLTFSEIVHNTYVSYQISTIRFRVLSISKVVVCHSLLIMHIVVYCVL